MAIIWTTILSLALAFGAGAVLAQNYNKGVNAYNTGDYATALTEFQALAEQGSARSQTFLGLMYKKGNGVLQDYAEALKWYRLAAQQGDTNAQHNLGVAYAKGEGVLLDYSEAFKWRRFAAKKKKARSQFNLGFLYANGNGVVLDYVKAHMWYNISSANGEDRAVELRDRAAAKLTSADISKAQNMAKECMRTNYKVCGW